MWVVWVLEIDVWNEGDSGGVLILCGVFFSYMYGMSERVNSYDIVLFVVWVIDREIKR